MSAPCAKNYAGTRARGFNDSLLGEDLPPRFEVTPEGHVTNWHGDRMGVSVEEFEDTGETYAPRA